MSYFVNRIAGKLSNPIYAFRAEKGSYPYLEYIDYQAIIDKSNYEYHLRQCVTRTPSARFDVIDNIVREMGNRLFTVEPSTHYRELPGVRERVAYPCEHHKNLADPLSDVIIHLNDQERWSRERIADFIRSLPNQERFTFK